MGPLGPTVSFSIMVMAKLSGAAQQQPEDERERKEGGSGCGFRMPLHYPRYKKADYEAMPEWRVDCLLREYGLPADGDLDSKRRFAMGAFLWPDQH
uniref:DUF7722 domain-containing protein n=2 Tax=Zea mays TaxID=4577 RepID=B6TG82_MAIZE|nr:hypothetical protein [Zea mays]